MAPDSDRAIAFSVYGPIERGDLAGLSDRVCRLLEHRPASVAFCEVGSVEPSAVTADALARLQLAAGRRGCQVRLRGASQQLLELIAFMGLDRVLPDDREL